LAFSEYFFGSSRHVDICCLKAWISTHFAWSVIGSLMPLGFINEVLGFHAFSCPLQNLYNPIVLLNHWNYVNEKPNCVQQKEQFINYNVGIYILICTCNALPLQVHPYGEGTPTQLLPRTMAAKIIVLSSKIKKYNTIKLAF